MMGMPLRSWWSFWRAKSDPQPRFTTPVARVPWPPAAQRFIADEQERAFFNLARAMNLGSAEEAYRQITGSTMPREHISVDKFERDLGRELSVEERRQAEEFALATYNTYFGSPLPSAYEDPNAYPLLLMIFDRFQQNLATGGRALEPSAIVATLPSGAVNARIINDSAIGVPVVFFERALFRFLKTFALLVGWAAPPIPLNDAEIMRQDWQQYMVPSEASRYFGDALATYIINGTPHEQSVPMPPSNAITVTTILDLMERFVLAHELAHVNLGHLARPRMSHEFEADSAALIAVTESAVQYGSRAVGIWSCDLALGAFEFLYRGLSVLAFGITGVQSPWISKTHPHMFLRRLNLRSRAARMTREAYPTTRRAAEHLWTESDIRLENLWKTTAGLLLDARTRGERPSALWNDEIRSQLMTSRL